MKNKPTLLKNILAEKCPKCRKGNMYSQKTIFPLRTMMKMPERCSHCGQRMEPEPGFYRPPNFVWTFS